MDLIEKPYSQASENNKAVILTQLARLLIDTKIVLEIGSGTGQHAIYFAQNMPHLSWLPSDLRANHQGIQMWLQDAELTNMLPLVELDVTQEKWPSGFDAAFTANTAHIMPWEVTKLMIQRVGENLPKGGLFALYGPFKYKGEFTTPSNAQFDVWLKERGAHQGIRDIEHVIDVAASVGLTMTEDNSMPANNQLLVFLKN